MNRRDFLLLRTDPHGRDARARDVELSCERLYMQWLDADTVQAGREDSDDSPEPSLWGGEPPPRLAGRSRRQLLEELDRELREVKIVRVMKSEWLVGDLREDFERLMEGFRARGGRVLVQT